jgi:putative endonuclease
LADHIQLGKIGESIALDFLIKSGYDILETNWSIGKAEVDIIARYEDILIFIEVKTRGSNQHGSPEEKVTSKKQRMISSAASKYMELIDYDWEVRFDIITVVYKNQNDFNLEHFKDAFYFGI